MSAPPYMKLYWGDYHKATRHLTRDQHGAYFLLIGEAWRLGGSLPDDDRMLAAWALCSPAEWAEIKDVVMAFFAARRGKWVHDRVREELASYEATSRKRKEAGRKGGSASHGKDNANSEANARLKPTKPEPEPEPVEGEANASSVGSAEPNPTASLFEVEEIEARPDPAPKAKPWELDPDFAALWSGATAEARSRAKSKENVWPHWRVAKAKAGGGARIVAAMARYRAKDPDVQRTGGPGLHIWLKDGTWDLWMSDDAGDQALPAASFPGPAGLRAAVVAAKDEAFAVGYLDPCGWEEGPPRRLIARNAFIASEITKAIGSQLQRAGVEVVVQQDRAA